MPISQSYLDNLQQLIEDIAEDFIAELGADKALVLFTQEIQSKEPCDHENSIIKSGMNQLKLFYYKPESLNLGPVENLIEFQATVVTMFRMSIRYKLKEKETEHFKSQIVILENNQSDSKIPIVENSHKDDELISKVKQLMTDLETEKHSALLFKQKVEELKSTTEEQRSHAEKTIIQQQENLHSLNEKLKAYEADTDQLKRDNAYQKETFEKEKQQYANENQKLRMEYETHSTQSSSTITQLNQKIEDLSNELRNANEHASALQVTLLHQSEESKLLIDSLKKQNATLESQLSSLRRESNNNSSVTNTKIIQTKVSTESTMESYAPDTSFNKDSVNSDFNLASFEAVSTLSDEAKHLLGKEFIHLYTKESEDFSVNLKVFGELALNLLKPENSVTIPKGFDFIYFKECVIRNFKSYKDSYKATLGLNKDSTYKNTDEWNLFNNFGLLLSNQEKSTRFQTVNLIIARVLTNLERNIETLEPGKLISHFRIGSGKTKCSEAEVLAAQISKTLNEGPNPTLSMPLKVQTVTTFIHEGYTSQELETLRNYSKNLTNQPPKSILAYIEKGNYEAAAMACPQQDLELLLKHLLEKLIKIDSIDQKLFAQNKADIPSEGSTHSSRA